MYWLGGCCCGLLQSCRCDAGRRQPQCKPSHQRMGVSVHALIAILLCILTILGKLQFLFFLPSCIYCFHLCCKGSLWRFSAQHMSKIHPSGFPSGWRQSCFPALLKSAWRTCFSMRCSAFLGCNFNCVESESKDLMWCYWSRFWLGLRTRLKTRGCKKRDEWAPHLCLRLWTRSQISITDKYKYPHLWRNCQSRHCAWCRCTVLTGSKNPCNKTAIFLDVVHRRCKCPSWIGRCESLM